MRVPSENSSVTSAVFFPDVVFMKSVIDSARRLREEDKERTNKTASMILLFPEPFGPDTTVYPSKKGIRVFLEKDLKLSIST